MLLLLVILTDWTSYKYFNRNYIGLHSSVTCTALKFSQDASHFSAAHPAHLHI